ncbi:MAG: MFS transporter [Chloroflexota bacterium]|nr:MFS transporter [Chloroflexota bacterium]
MESEKSLAKFGIRLIVAILTLLGGSLVIFTAQASTNIFSTFLPVLASANLGIQSDQVTKLSLIALATTILSAPLFGFYGDRVGRRKLELIGALVLGVSIAATSQMANVPTLALGYIGVAIGTSMLLTSLIAQMFEDTGTHWLLASVAALYFAMTQLGGAVANVFGSLLMQPIGVKTELIIAGLAVLAGGSVGMGFVALSYVLRRRYVWQDEWLDSARDKAHSVSLTLIFMAVFLIGWTTTSIGSFVALYATMQLGLRVSDVGLAFGALGVALVVIALALPFAGLLADLLDWLTLRIVRRQLGRQLFVAIGAFILCSGLGILLLAKDTQGITGSLIVARLGSAILSPSLLAVVIARAPHRLWGTMAGLYLAVSAASSLGNTVSSFVADVLGLASPFVLGIVVTALALLLIVVASMFEKERR